MKLDGPAESLSDEDQRGAGSGIDGGDREKAQG